MSELTNKDRFVSSVLGYLGSRLIWALGTSMRIRVIGVEHERDVKASNDSWILAVLHGRMVVPLYTHRNRGITGLSSPSKDGEIITNVVRNLGYKAVRGSSRNQAAAGLRGMIRMAKSSVVANMVDGPTGPREEPKPGTIAIAMAAGIPIVPLIGAASPAWEWERSWDRFQLPRPFSRGVVIIGEPMMIPDDEKAEDLEKWRLELKHRMISLREQADGLVWREGIRPGLLSPLGALWSVGVRLRGALYNAGIKRIVSSPVPVVSIGNLTAGGSGKSPAVFEVVRKLKIISAGSRPVIVSRGYKRATKGLVVVSDGKGMIVSPRNGGDEPVMLAKALPDIPVVVAEKRVAGIRCATDHLGATVVVLDDGFQHRGVGRDLDVVLLDVSTPSWHWRPLPGGRMREGFSALKRAQVVILTGHAPESVVEELKRKVREVVDLPILRGAIEPVSLRSLNTAIRKPVSSLDGRNVALAAGIARPRRFFDSAEKAGAVPVLYRTWPDHSSIPRETVDRLMRKARNRQAEFVLITAKDAVKWPDAKADDLEVFVLETEWRWREGEDRLDSDLRRLVGEPSIP
ncbi:MAG: tetraacyldisaccharide 4'-kinase [bacterium]